MSKIVVSLLLMVGLCGCQLAKEVVVTGEDELIGVFITMESLNIHDFEATLNNKDDINNGKKYASLIMEPYINEAGQSKEMPAYVFEDLEGIPFLNAEIEEDGETYRSMADTNGYLSNLKLATNITDDSREYVLEGKLYYKVGIQDMVFYANPVYQESNGNVYVEQAAGLSMMDSMEGQSGSNEIDASMTLTENNKTITNKTSVTVSYESMFEPIKTSIIEMNKENEVVLISEYKNNIFPDSLDLNNETEYVLVETTKLDTTNKEIVTREIFSKNDDSINVYELKDNGLIIVKNIIMNLIN
ncbi:hypothetical protein [Anaerorhabdus sp.]|uniref:hypothetical protein n=1 Tax=Anaerorhabdus sp. TaxID=1872524 RepID=UPI002B203419|nr:hypothetical protein [Anaerorhabdus sp.]MEA4875319.1 hypothetical protein [Anaerorhabdus sp.]